MKERKANESGKEAWLLLAAAAAAVLLIVDNIKDRCSIGFSIRWGYRKPDSTNPLHFAGAQQMVLTNGAFLQRKTLKKGP